MQVQTLSASRGRFWVVAGWEILTRDTGLWVGVTATYLAIAFVLGQIPFIGYLLFVWLSPIFAAGAITAADALVRADQPIPAFSGDTLTGRLRRGFGQSVSTLFQVFWQPENTLAVMIVGTIVLGGMVVIQILAQLLQVGGPALSAMVHGSVGPAIWVPALFSLALVWTLRLSLILVALYAVHLVTLHRATSFQALELSFQALARNPLPLALFGGAFLIPMFVSAHFGVAATYAVHLLMLPVLLLSTIASYRDLFGS